MVLSWDFSVGKTSESLYKNDNIEVVRGWISSLSLPQLVVRGAPLPLGRWKLPDAKESLRCPRQQLIHLNQEKNNRIIYSKNLNRKTTSSTQIPLLFTSLGWKKTTWFTSPSPRHWRCLSALHAWAKALRWPGARVLQPSEERIDHLHRWTAVVF